MTQNEVLVDALHRTALIHQPHALKAYLAMKNLTCRFPTFGDQEWSQCKNLISITEVEVSTVFSSSIEYKELSDERIRRILLRGLLPIGYVAVKQWYERVGIDSIFEHYINLTVENNEYLSHNISILLSLKEAFQELSSDQIPLFLDRFVEYVSSTFRETISTTRTSDNLLSIDINEVLTSSLKQPGFFGHNLITLSWLLRSKKSLESKIYNQLITHLFEQSKWELDDPDDRVNYSFLSECASVATEKEFEKLIYSLIHGQNKNLHQVTLADSLAHLWDMFPEQRSAISQLATYYSTYRN